MIQYDGKQSQTTHQAFEWLYDEEISNHSLSYQNNEQHMLSIQASVTSGRKHCSAE